VSIGRVVSGELDAAELTAVRRLLDDAFDGDFSEDDWANALGGTHVLLSQDDVSVSHASVVPRCLLVGGRQVSAGYVEAVATRADRRRNGFATQVLIEVARVIGEGYELGALSTGMPTLYERVGWQRWLGPTFASAPGGLRRTAEDDGGVMVLRTDAAERLDLHAAIACDWRRGDVW